MRSRRLGPGADERPDFIALNALAGQVPQRLVLVGRAGHEDDPTDRVARDQASENSGAGFDV